MADMSSIVLDKHPLDTQRAYVLFTLGVIFPIFTTLFVIARLVSRHMKGNMYGVNDLLLIIALIFYYTLTVGLHYMVFSAWNGHHTVSVPDPIGSLAMSFKLGFFTTLSYALIATAVRCSTCVLFLRVFIQRYYRYAASANLVFNTMWGIYSIFVTIFRCSPVQKGLDPTLPGTCLDQTQVLLSLTIWGVICDAITWALPVPMVWQLHAPLSYKIALTGVLALGLVAVAIGGLRIWTVATLSFTDPLWDLPLASYWAYIETGIGIICASAAAIAPVFEKIILGPMRKLCSSISTLMSSSHKSEQTRSSALTSISGSGSRSRDTREKPAWSFPAMSKGTHSVSIRAANSPTPPNARSGQVEMRTEVSVTQDV